MAGDEAETWARALKECAGLDPGGDGQPLKGVTYSGGHTNPYCDKISRYYTHTHRHTMAHVKPGEIQRRPATVSDAWF